MKQTFQLKLPISAPSAAQRRDRRAHGGECSRGRRKTKRPFAAKQSMHVVLRSTRARGSLSLLHPRHCKNVWQVVCRTQIRWKVRVYRYANVGNHVHLLVRAQTRRDWQGFIRELAGGIAMIVTGARKGYAFTANKPAEQRWSKSIDSTRTFWDELAYSRIVSWGREFSAVANYVAINLWEGSGISLRQYLHRGLQILEISDSGFLIGSPLAKKLLVT